jgi:hypothetical protein
MVLGLAVVLLASQGCAALGLALLTAGVGTGAGQGVSYTLDSIGYKTFTTPVENLETATLKTLKRMDIEVKEKEKTDSGIKISAKAGDRDVDIELDRLTSQTARMRVDATLKWIFKDRATAVEIIAQTAQTLEDQARLAQSQAARAAMARPASMPTIKAQPVSATAPAR